MKLIVNTLTYFLREDAGLPLVAKKALVLGKLHTTQALVLGRLRRCGHRGQGYGYSPVLFDCFIKYGG